MTLTCISGRSKDGRDPHIHKIPRSKVSRFRRQSGQTNGLANGTDCFTLPAYAVVEYRASGSQTTGWTDKRPGMACTALALRCAIKNTLRLILARIVNWSKERHHRREYIRHARARLTNERNVPRRLHGNGVWRPTCVNRDRDARV